jgi:DNA polymerase III subunit delta'
MDDLVLHDSTMLQLQNFMSKPAHAVLLAGADGIGKTAIAEALVCALLDIEKQKLPAYPHYLKIELTGTSISIDAIRELARFLQLKTIGTQPLRRVVLIEHAQGMTTEAQNAYLKLLEEPPADTLMILTADSPRALLPTILSRVQTITIHPPTEPQLQALLRSSDKDAATLKQAYFLSGGLPGLLCALISDDKTHPLLTSVSTAKEILQKPLFERLAMVDALSKQKDDAKLIVEALERIAEAMVEQGAIKQEPARIKQWHRIRKAAIEASEALDQSANAKLTLSNLFLHL